MLWGYQLNPEEPKAQQLWNQTSWPISFSIVLRVLFDFWYIKLIESASIKMFQVVLIIDTPRATHQFKKKKSSLFEFTCFCPSSFPHSWWLKSWGPHECHCFFLGQMPSTQAVWPFLCIASHSFRHLWYLSTWSGCSPDSPLPPIWHIPAKFMFKKTKSEPSYLSNLSPDYSHAERLLWSS